jgi:citrate lyase beta subunit
MARASVVLASTAERLDPPLDSPWLKIADLDGLRAAAERARADGFGGMLLIHPSHVTTVNQVFSPTASELAWAQGIVASSAEAQAGGRGAYTRDGQMVDEAIVKRARAILRDAQP